MLTDSLSPAALRAATPEQLHTLAGEIRTFLIDRVCRTGGHLGPNLGVVELTMALHRVFDSPRTPIVFDTGHQAYVHKVLTGRAAGFDRLRGRGGLSGYPKRSESVHDVMENSHASTALAYADGLAKAFELAGEHRTVVAVIGDGALTGGLALEALNNLAVAHRRVVIVLNDNGRSYAPTVGGLGQHLARLHEAAGLTTLVQRLGGSDRIAAQDTGPANLFTTLGLRYLGPVDGHDLEALEESLRRAAARAADGPVVLHCRTRKGLGYRPAETDPADRMHSVGVLDPATGKPKSAKGPTWTNVFADRLADLFDRRDDLVAISAAMLGPTGLQHVADRYPTRCFDVGIAEQEAVTSAAGLAMGGAHPIVGIYSTFVQRAFDQTVLDVGLHRLPVTFVLDRAGITGPDGPSHHGMLDLALFGMVPGMRVAAPRDADTLAAELDEAVSWSYGPTMLRFPKAAVGEPVAAVGRYGGVDVLRAPGPRADGEQGRGDHTKEVDAEVLLVSVGPCATEAVAAADQLAASGLDCTVVDPRWVLPPHPDLIALAARHRLVVTVEDGVRTGGVGDHLRRLLQDTGVTVPVAVIGLPNAYLPHAPRADLLARYGLTAPGIVAAVAQSARRHGVAPSASGPGGRRHLFAIPGSGGRAASTRPAPPVREQRPAHGGARGLVFARRRRGAQ